MYANVSTWIQNRKRPNMSEQNDEIPQGQSAYRRLLDEIRNGGVLAPGMRLREVEIAERLGLSRTPVREAMRLLEGDGWWCISRASARRCARSIMPRSWSFTRCARCLKHGARLAARAASEVELSELTASTRNLPQHLAIRHRPPRSTASSI